MLIYPPADFGDFLARMRNTGGLEFSPLGTPVVENPAGGFTTEYNWAQARSIVERSFKIRNALLESPTSPVVALNSFGKIVRENGPRNHPPVLIIHGGSDALLHHSQAIALCEGYGGAVTDRWTTSARSVHRCGSTSYLHLLKEAQHAFEICPRATAGAVCLAGSSRAAATAANSLELGRNWLLDPRREPIP
jgi:hypothetical protein